MLWQNSMEIDLTRRIAARIPRIAKPDRLCPSLVNASLTALYDNFLTFTSPTIRFAKLNKTRAAAVLGAVDQARLGSSPQPANKRLPAKLETANAPSLIRNGGHFKWPVLRSEDLI